MNPFFFLLFVFLFGCEGAGGGESGGAQEQFDEEEWSERLEDE